MFGGTGQDGSYLIEHLVASGHEVVATRRSQFTPVAGGRALDGVRWLWADLRNEDVVTSVVIDARPDVVFNLAAVTTPGSSWLDGTATGLEVAEVNALGALRVMRAVNRCAPTARVVHASSSAIYDPYRYGLYGASKAFAHDVVQGYRSRGVWAANAVLFSHTSPRQDPRFLVPHICRAAARIHRGSDERLSIDAPDSRRDWLGARDAVRALAMIAERGEPVDYDVASGRQWSVAGVVGLALTGTGRAIWDVVADGGQLATIERPADPTLLRGLGWRPEHELEDVVSEMVRDALMQKGSAS